MLQLYYQATIRKGTHTNMHLQSQSLRLVLANGETIYLHVNLHILIPTLIFMQVVLRGHLTTQASGADPLVSHNIASTIHMRYVHVVGDVYILTGEASHALLQEKLMPAKLNTWP